MSRPKVSFALRGKPDAWGLIALALRYAFKYKTNYIWTSIRLKKSEWNPKRQCLRPRSATMANGQLPARVEVAILDIKAKAVRIVEGLEKDRISPSFVHFKRRWEDAGEKQATQTPSEKGHELGERKLVEVSASVLDFEVKTQMISESTKDAYMAAVRSLNKFRPDITVGEIDRKVLLEYKIHLIETSGDNLASQYLRNVKMVFSVLIKNHKWENDPFANVKITKPERMGDKKSMTEAEYRTIYDRYKSLPIGERESEALRRFLVMCRGFRFSDTSLIQKKHYIEFQRDGKVFRAISKKAQKNKVSGLAPMSEEDAQWLLRWTPDGRLFENVSYNTYRNALADATQKAIGRKLTTHYGRHFAGDHALNHWGLSLDEVKTVLGLSSQNMAEVYAQYDKILVLEKINTKQ